jgi:hypothetical protein
VSPATTQDNIDIINKNNYDIFPTNAFIATTSFETKGDIAYVDSAATHHYFMQRNMFSDYVEITHRNAGSATNGSPFWIIGTGTVQIETVIHGEKSSVLLRNAMHSDNILANLISLSQFDRNGFGFHACAGELNVYNPKTG